GKTKAGPFILGRSQERPCDLVDHRQGEERLAAIELQLDVAPALDLFPDDGLYQESGGGRSHVILSAEMVLVAVGAGQIAVQVEHHRGTEFIAALVGPADERMHLLLLGQQVIGEDLKTGQGASLRIGQGICVDGFEQLRRNAQERPFFRGVEQERSRTFRIRVDLKVAGKGHGRLQTLINRISALTKLFSVKKIKNYF